MGQQQLLLLVLGVLIVAAAVFVGIDMFDQNRRKVAADAITKDGLRIATEAQAWRLKPGSLGGGAGNASATPWAGISFEKLLMATLFIGNEDSLPGSNEYRTPNGVFQLAADGATLTVTGENSLSRITVRVTGTNSENIETELETLK